MRGDKEYEARGRVIQARAMHNSTIFAVAAELLVLLFNWHNIDFLYVICCLSNK